MGAFSGKRAVRNISAAVAVPLLGLVGLPSVAGAEPFAHNLSVKLAGSPAVFTPKVITATLSSNPLCSTTNYTFKIVNRTGKTQYIEIGGKPIGVSLLAGRTQYECVGVGTAIFGVVSNPKATLKVTVVK